MSMMFHSRRPMAISAILSPSESAHSSFSSDPTEVEKQLHLPSPKSTMDRDYHHRRASTTSSAFLSPPITLEERRLRNKIASARYRAKKNLQHDEMRSLIASLTRENEILQRQLEHVGHENSRLKATCDRLRGKILADKLIKRMLTNQNHGQNDSHSNSTYGDCVDFYMPSS
ncbi:hypothetical protein BX666DRAFT_1983742 [Dichotomocladium elegans]|nr:hypothetical protein BX666DRAFT_1983742 [Dichotomocladium elegans]